MSTADARPSASDWYTERIRAGDWNSIFERDWPRFLAIAHKMRLLRPSLTPEDCSDIAQNTVMNIYRGANTYDPSRHSYIAWSNEICRNEVFKALRTRLGPGGDALDRPNPANLEHAELLPDNDPNLERIEIRTAVEEVLASLDEGERQALHMYYWQEAKPQEIADALGVRLDTIRKRINRARRKLYKLLCEKSGAANHEMEDK